MTEANRDPEEWIEAMAVRMQDSSTAPDEFIERLRASGELHPEERVVARLRARIERLRHIEASLSGPPDSELAPGIEVDDFVIQSYLGQGGMGQVFRARQKSLGRDVAIKTPLWAGRLDEREMARFWREAEAIALLRHPAIVPLYQMGEHHGVPYFVMELVEGRTLAQLMAELRNGPIPATGEELGRPRDKLAASCCRNWCSHPGRRRQCA